MKDLRPPKFFLRFFRWYCNPRLLPHIEGDLLELFGERLSAKGRWNASVRFAIDVLMMFRPGIVRNVSLESTTNHNDMLNNYLKVGIRNMFRHKAFALINISGLAIAMSVCLLVILLLADQYSYDTFHPNRERIYRILSDRPYASRPMASTPPLLATSLREGYAPIEAAANLIIGVGGDAVVGDKAIEMRGFFADENFFKVFGFGLDQGDQYTALNSPHGIVISRSVAKALFGDEDALGKVVTFYNRGLHYLKQGKDSPPVSWGSFAITGVLADNHEKSHLRFDVLMSGATRKLLIADGKAGDSDGGWDNAYTYVLLRTGQTEAALNQSLSSLFEREFAPNEGLKDFRLFGQALPSITPGIMVDQPPSFQLNKTAYYVLGWIALAIMLSACLNYTNLSNARALTRLKEIGVRKVTGARKRDLILQFLSESITTSVLALVLAMGLLSILKPAFTNLWLNRYLQLAPTFSPMVYVYFVGFALVAGVVAGIFPALYLSRFQPIRAMTNASGGGGRRGLRRVLGVSQFTVSLFFVVTSLLIYTQYRYFMRFDYGFQSKGIVNVALQGNDYARVAQALGSVAGVSQVSASEYVPGTGRTSGMQLNNPRGGEALNFRILAANETFLPNLGLKIIAGRNVMATVDSLSSDIVVNETGARELGFTQPVDAVGAIVVQTWNNQPLQIVGVVEDFWAKLPIGGDRLDPLFIQHLPKQLSYANVRLEGGNDRQTLATLERVWKTVDPLHPFRYDYYEEELASTHAGIYDVVSIVGLLAFIAVTVACLGMLGMATYTAERKRKEVGIRKVLGAESMSIVLFLSKEFMWVVSVAIFIGGPLSYFVNNAWLQMFPTRAPFGIWIVAVGAVIVTTLGLVVIGSQTVRASRANPAESLRSE